MKPPSCVNPSTDPLPTGGRLPTDGSLSDDISTQIDQAFSNVDLALRDAGGKGWEQVYQVRSYHVGLDEVAKKGMVENLKRWCPGHQPLWTMIGVATLAEGVMKVEIEVVAIDG